MTDGVAAADAVAAAVDAHVGVAPEQVHVRMYRALDPIPDGSADGSVDGIGDHRGLLGDCFLIRLEAGEVRSHILIDCGLLLGSPKAAERMRAVAADIVSTCAGRLDLLIVTHEHWDHLSGFSQAADVLLDPAKLAIGTAWMAWTEDPADPLANSLRTRFDRTGFALASIAGRIRDGDTPFGPDAARSKLGGVDAFMGKPVAGSSQNRPRLTTRDILARLKAGAGEVCYLRPGETRRTPGPVSLPAYVLGPPRDLPLLFRDTPSAVTPETYLDAPTVDGGQLLRLADGGLPDPARDSPFAPDYCRFTIADMEARLAAGDGDDLRSCEFLRRHYHGTAGMADWQKAAMDRRRIDADWLGTAGAMALKMDSDTNNTSLALAFELPDDARDVMLFPGDAQVGNWLSWGNQAYKTPDGSPVTIDQLLARTLLYKVGHHGSHNATLAARGLALMTNDRLFAMIPTDEELARRQGAGGWQMPNPRVRAALKAQTGGRILRNDRRYPSAARTAAQNERLRADPDVTAIPQGFLDRLVETDLFLEYPLMEGPSA
ncbi:MBL fold metallo-hydrolase [Sphingomonas bacterium]|uniref:MBL fold metallo-hydrolase n=1 Tax=Sphingomonas bacterium TaxID=1895847 RepID=UPI0015756D85|nr:MBL fold metallo-hydrolase [Sphingomonas bacterium]